MSSDGGACGCGPPAPAAAGARLMLNPLRSESDAFRLLLYVIAVFGTIIAIVLIVRAI